MTYKDILNVSNTLMAAGLAGDNYKLVKKKKKKLKDYIGQGTKNIVGTSLIKANAEFIWQ